jgi:purine-binding chemotaxis protein CheW
MMKSIESPTPEKKLVTRQSSLTLRGEDLADEPYGFLCFELEDEVFGVDLNLVSQVVKPPPLTWVPRMGPHILGIISIRGAVVTLIDFRQLVGLGPTSWPRSARVLIVEINEERIGLLVDGVTHVERVRPDALEKAPSLGEAAYADRVLLVARTDLNKPILVIDLDGILGDYMK